MEDFFKPFADRPLTEKQTKYIMRGVVAVFGAICVALVFVVERLGAVLQLSMSLGAVAQGPLLGIFTMGVMFPWVHGTVSVTPSRDATLMYPLIIEKRCNKRKLKMLTGRFSR